MIAIRLLMSVPMLVLLTWEAAAQSAQQPTPDKKSAETKHE